MLRLRLACAALLVFAPLAAADTLGYAQARAFAERDEDALPAAESEALLAAHGEIIGEAVPACVDPANPPAYIRLAVVMELDSHGRVVRTWRRDNDALTTCFEGRWAGVRLSVPPRAPFYTFIELDIDVTREQ